MLKKPKKRFSRVLSGVLAVLIATPNLMQLAASAEEGEKFQYTMFGRNGIAMSGSSNLCMNGNLHTNKEAEITATNKNINGTVTTASNIEKRIKHVYADQKIYDTYFTTNCELHEEYVCSDMNIHINNPIFAYNSIVLSGNISLNSYLGTYMDIYITGEVENANNAVLYSKYGDITIDTDNVANMNGLVYAPLGTVTIDASNVNLNGVIIADQVVINGSSVNINCNDNIARFIGETSEEYDFSGLEYLPEEWLGDTDADALFDIYEKVIDSDPFNPDTDGDGLPDGYEVLTLNTDPLEIDTDGNGVLDGNEDFDTDNLVNIDEYHNQTLSFIPDTDEDGFVDGDEVHIYGTIPTNPDTDGDDLLDGEESYDGSIYLEYGVYFDPLNPDTDGDGIADGDEVFGQTKEQEVQTQDEAITEVIVDMETNGNIDRNLTVESMQGIDAMTSNVHALVGEPFNFETESDFESATITFKIDQSKLGDTQFDKLLILWYNEEKQIFEEMPTTYDVVNSTVSTTTTHFSQYMVVDSEKWFENWDNSLSKHREMWSGGTTYTRNLHTLFLIDCSTSMLEDDSILRTFKVGFNGVTEENWNEIRNDIPSTVEGYLKKYGYNDCTRATICENIIDSLGKSDAGRIITFSNNVEFDSGYSYKHQYLKEAAQHVNNDGGKASLNAALDYACLCIDGNSTDLYRIIVITNDAVSFGKISADDFSSNTMLNIVNLGSSEIGRNIDAVAQATGGDVYNAISASVLTSQHGETTYTPPQFIGIDSDGDTIPDIVEEYGLKPNGEPIGTNPNLKDSDGDGIEDQIELGYMNINQIVNTPQGYLEYLTYTSDPAKADTDGDGIKDDQDVYTMWNDPDPLGPTNIQSVQYINIPVQKPQNFKDHISRFLMSTDDRDFTLSIVKSRKIQDDIFFAYAEGSDNTGGFVITEELKSTLDDLEKGYQENGEGNSTVEEAAAHAAKLETDQLVPEYFEYESSAYYGCWAYNCQSEINVLNRYINAIDKATNAYMIYITILGIYQTKLTSLQQNSVTISSKEYVTANHGTKPQVKLKISSKQLGKKWGEHMVDYPEMSSYSEYEQVARNVFNSPDKIVLNYSKGEYYYIKNKHLLRVKLDGSFVSLYPGVDSNIVIKAIDSGGTIWVN